MPYDRIYTLRIYTVYYTVDVYSLENGQYIRVYGIRLHTAKSTPYMASGLYSFFIFSLVSAEARHKHDNSHFQGY